MNRIARIELSMVDLAPKVRRSDAIQSFDSQETPIVRITDADGVTGTGYTYTIGQGGPAIVSLLKETLLPRLIGEDADRIERLWRDGLFATHATAVGAITSLSLAAIDIALWDLRARRANLPLHVLLGGSQDRVPMYTTEGGWLHLGTDELVSDALAAQAIGFGGCKIKVGRPRLAEDRARLAAVREAVGADFEIMVDANQSFSLAEARRRARMFEAFDIAWFEEPLPADDVLSHRALAAGTSIPIAVGESLYSLSQFKDYLTSGAASIVQADVARIGGITPWLKAAHMAEGFNAPICPHFLMELHASLVCAVPNAPWLEYIPQLEDLTQAGLRTEAGHAYPPDSPGIGIDWDEPGLAKAALDGFSFTFGG